ncbi:MAG: CHAT domain-containing protein, partial [Candidatus Hydrogenedentes bacterium]|nr:CHAT domain-containing protein [Candidatus Hydrogenedentota bacterium]
FIREVTTAGDGACADGVAWGRLPAFRHHILDLHHDIEESGLPVAPPALGLAACEAAVRGLRGPRILLFATHGYYCSPSPTAATGAVPALSGGDRGHAASGAHPLLRSGLILAGGNSLPPLLRKPDLPFAELARIAANDGNLTALEVSSLDLQGTDLVSLVACETGLGDIEAGVGVAGLRSAFQIAGARSVQMSLFEVPVMLMDEADRAALAAAGTPVADAITFNSAFYRNWLAAGDRPMKKLNAHHQAQLEVLRAARANPIATLASGHPFWWGAYVLIGDPN